MPLLMLKENLDRTVLAKLRLHSVTEPDLDSWKDFLGKLKNPTSEVKIALIGKYVELADAYKSIRESFIHAGAVNECHVDVISIHSEHINAENVHHLLGGLDGILVAPGFGARGLKERLRRSNTRGRITSVLRHLPRLQCAVGICTKCWDWKPIQRKSTPTPGSRD